MNSLKKRDARMITEYKYMHTSIGHCNHFYIEIFQNPLAISKMTPVCFFFLQMYVEDTIATITGLVDSVFYLSPVRRLDTYCILIDKYISYRETVTGRCTAEMFLVSIPS